MLPGGSCCLQFGDLGGSKGGEQQCCLSLGSAAEAMNALPHSALCLGCWGLRGQAQAAIEKGVQRCSTEPAPAPPPAPVLLRSLLWLYPECLQPSTM